ncbi:Rz-like spanin [Ralstonia phage AhaGv]|nr:Rz-like spanin [Ralstonia phage AhaGv]
MNLINWKGYAIAAGAGALVAAILAGWGAWAIQANRYDVQIAELKRVHAEQLGEIAAKGAEQAREALAWKDRAEKATAEIDARQQENDRVKAENARLADELRTGARRVFVRAKCPAAGGGAVPGTAPAARVDDAEVRAELDPATAQRMVGVAGDGDDAIRALTALQDYVGRVCLAPRQ